MIEILSSPDRRFAIVRRATSCRAASIGAALGLLLSLATGPAHALGLGEVVEQSSLGEPLRFAIPVLVNADDLAAGELAPECFKLVPGESARSGELPQMSFGRALLERDAAGVRVVVSSNAIAAEPALSFTVQAGCRLKLRHEYTVLLDPPIIREPAAQSGNEATAPPRRAAASTAAALAAGGSSVASSRAGARVKPPAHSVKRTTATSGSAQRAAALKTPAPPPAKDGRPRLSVSRSAHDHSPDASATDIAQGKSDDEIRREVEAETVVLQRRIAELSTTLERMEAELRAATAAREAAERTAKAPPPPPSGPDPWLLSVALAAAILALAVMLIRSRRASSLVIPAFARAEGAIADDAPAELGSGVGAALRTTRPVATAATLAQAPQADARPDDDSFEEDLLSYAQQLSAYSILEREQPKVVASIVREWGQPKVIAYLRELLVAPRKASRPFSREAVSDLTFLQGLAMERAGYGSDESPWQVELDEGRLRSA